MAQINYDRLDKNNYQSSVNSDSATAVNNPRNYLQSNKNYAVTSFVLALVSVITFFLPILGQVIPILAIVFSVADRKNEKNVFNQSALILGIIFLIVSLLMLFLYLLHWNTFYYYFLFEILD